MKKIEFPKDKPLYTTGVVAKLLNITPDRLRSYDTDLLMSTEREKTGQISRRMYTQVDVEWLMAIRELISAHNMSINSIKAILKLLYLNPEINLPQDKLGEIYKALQSNPNLKLLAKKY